MNKFDINKIPKNILDNYNISEFDNPSEAFNFLFDEDFTKEDIISMLSDEMKDELVRQNDNIRKCKDKYYYCSEIDSLEEDIEEIERKNSVNMPTNDRVLFFTKIIWEEPKIDNSIHNGEMVEILDIKRGKDKFNDRYTVKFNDGTITDGILLCELDFEHYIPGDRIYEDEEEEEL